MWCIGELTHECRQRMYHLLALYEQPVQAREPVVCIDEKSVQLIAHSRAPLPMRPGSPAKDDYEYVRNGTTNLFVAVESKAGHREVSVTAHRGKLDFVPFANELLQGTYANARRVNLVLDNLNTHFRKSFEDVLGVRAATKLLRPGAVPLHTQARQLVEHGRDRNRHPRPSVPGSQAAQSFRPGRRSRRLAAQSQ